MPRTGAPEGKPSYLSGREFFKLLAVLSGTSRNHDLESRTAARVWGYEAA